MVKTRSAAELELMRKSGQISAFALRKVLNAIEPGVSGLKLDRIAEDEIKRLGGESSFKTVKGYNWTICITINEEVVHGIPTERVLEVGDIVSIDLGSVYKGWHSDTAWSVLVQSSIPRFHSGQEFKVQSQEKEKMRFLETGKEALKLGIKEAIDGNQIGDISEAIQKKVERMGYSVVRSLIGHGVGRELHEEPGVPGYGKAGTGLVLRTGMTLAIEVIYTMGKPEVGLEKDGWTVSSLDRSLAAVFEMTVIVGKKKASVLTDWRKV